MLTACFLLWCLGNERRPAERVSLTNDFRDNGRSERMFGYERQFLVFGVVDQSTADDALFVGALPLNVRLLPRFLFTGGAVIASTPVPRAGTNANFLARLQLDVTDRIGITYSHWSNAHLGGHDGSVNSFGVTFRLRSQ